MCEHLSFILQVNHAGLISAGYQIPPHKLIFVCLWPASKHRWQTGSAASRSPMHHPIPLLTFCLIHIAAWWELEGWVLRWRALLFHLWVCVCLAPSSVGTYWVSRSTARASPQAPAGDSPGIPKQMAVTPCADLTLSIRHVSSQIYTKGHLLSRLLEHIIIVWLLSRVLNYC